MYDRIWPWRKAAGLCLVLFFAVGSLSLDADDLLRVTASMSPRRLSRGQEGKVVLKVVLRKGILINSQPQFIIEFEPSKEVVFPKNFFTASDLEIETWKENGREYLDLKKPIEIPFFIDESAQRGNHKLKGRVKYFASSLKEGVCIKTTTGFSASFYTLNRIYRKRR